MLVVGGTVELTPVAPAGGDHPQSETQAAPVPQGGTGLLVALCVAPAPARAAAPTTKPGSKEQPAARLTWSEVEDAPAGGGAAGQQQGGGEGPDARPTPRAGHACCINGSRLFMIGGFMTETKNYLPEVSMSRSVAASNSAFMQLFSGGISLCGQYHSCRCNCRCNCLGNVFPTDTQPGTQLVGTHHVSCVGVGSGAGSQHSTFMPHWPPQGRSASSSTGCSQPCYLCGCCFSSDVKPP
jgi:hypothetical protein